VKIKEDSRSRQNPKTPKNKNKSLLWTLPSTTAATLTTLTCQVRVRELVRAMVIKGHPTVILTSLMSIIKWDNSTTKDTPLTTRDPLWTMENNTPQNPERITTPMLVSLPRKATTRIHQPPLAQTPIPAPAPTSADSRSSLMAPSWSTKSKKKAVTPPSSRMNKSMLAVWWPWDLVPTLFPFQVSWKKNLEKIEFSFISLLFFTKFFDFFLFWVLCFCEMKIYFRRNLTECLSLWLYVGTSICQPPQMNRNT